MSSDTQIEIKAEEEPQGKGRFQRLREWMGGKLYGEGLPERIQDTWGRMHKVGGFLPLFIEGRLEYRTEKQEEVLNTIRGEFELCKTYETLNQAMFKANLKVFILFHTTGTQWLGGLSDGFTAKKIRSYLEFFQRVGSNSSFTKDIFTASMQMINISWKPQDVQRLPPYLIETKTVIQPTQQRGVNMNEVQVF